MHGFDMPFPEKCQTTKECREVYTLMHISILSHAESVKLYREKYQVWFHHDANKIKWISGLIWIYMSSMQFNKQN